jgi:hypothetical protein
VNFLPPLLSCGETSWTFFFLPYLNHMHKTTVMPDMVVHALIPATWKVKVEEFQV